MLTRPDSLTINLKSCSIFTGHDKKWILAAGVSIALSILLVGIAGLVSLYFMKKKPAAGKFCCHGE
jgi:hypothetical protein